MADHRPAHRALLGTGALAALWLLWPLLRPALAPARGSTLVVVFDGYHRLDAALTRAGRLPLLLLTCPRTGQPTAEQRQRSIGRPFWVVEEGWDSAHQLTVLARWLQQPPSSLPPITRVQLVSDSHHLPRLVPAAPPLADRPRLAAPAALARHRQHRRLPGAPDPAPQAGRLRLTPT